MDNILPHTFKIYWMEDQWRSTPPVSDRVLSNKEISSWKMKVPRKMNQTDLSKALEKMLLRLLS